MTEYLLILYPIALLIITFYQCNVEKGDSFTEDMFSLNQAKMLQATACLFIVLHHLSQKISGYGDIYRGPITILSSMGILFTSIFFFCSGYGLIYSVNTKESYLKNFIRHRLITVLVPFFTANTIAVLIRVFYEKIQMSSIQVVQCVTGYVLINGNGWYIVEIFFIYLAFYFIFTIVKNKKVASVILGLSAVLLVYIGYKRGHDTSSLGNHWFKGEWWYNSTIVFILGVIFANCKDRLIPVIKRYYKVLLITFSILFFVSFYIEEIIRKRYGYYNNARVIGGMDGKFITLLSQMILCVLFMCLVLLINVRVRIGNKILTFISTISMELFLVHGLFINNIISFRGRNEFFNFLIVFICGIISAVAVNAVDKKIIAVLSGLHKNKDYLNDCEINLIREKKEKRVRRIKYTVCIVVVLAITASLIREFIIIPRECGKEIAVLKESKVSDVVKFGRYEINPALIGDERVEWVILKIEGGKAMLVSKEGIESSAYNDKHEEVSWQDSDLYIYLNEYMYDRMFSENEKKYILENTNAGEYVSLLTPYEAEELFGDNVGRELLASTYAFKKGVNVNTPSKINSWDYKDYRASWWWLRGESGITAPIVTPEGNIETDTKFVNKPNGAVRPVIWIDFER